MQAGDAPLTLLPADVLLKVCPWAQDATTLFSFLEALGTPQARGPFEPLWQLGATMSDREPLWPSLVLTEAVFQNPERLHLMESVIQHYSTVTVKWVGDLGWLHVHLAPHTAVTWVAAFPSSRFPVIHGTPSTIDAWFDLWAQLRLTKLAIRNPTYDIDSEPALDPDFVPFFERALVRCCHVQSLTVECWSPSLGAIFELAAHSSTLVYLDIMVPFPIFVDAESPHLNAAQLVHATKWLTCTPVQHVCLSYVGLEPATDAAVRQEFFAALFSCSTLHFVQTYGRDFGPMALQDVLPSTLTLQSLFLCGVLLEPAALSALARAVRDSTNLKHLCVRGFGTLNRTDYDTTFHELFDAVAHSKVRDFEASSWPLGDARWSDLGPCVVKMPHVETLTLSYTLMRAAGAVYLAQAIQVNTSLSKVEVSGNDIAADGVRWLVHASAHRSPPMALVCAANCACSRDEKPLLRALAHELGVDLSI
ncbi:Aste57867_6963 [Aphanomyces stellatus]|uniref:Aste57867_6963 protein n=1 Tax=Aphanomyces stellatus TaxID=120398 RepID=A0A485KHZ2_9STRA|nr:hypothetical protein As57867_006941 [Aphanomyces stellatus]VFT83915.1 Aste57867_6963 [Aphanomyces stellatus]